MQRNSCPVKRKNFYFTPKRFFSYLLLLMIPRIVQKTLHRFGMIYRGPVNSALDIMLLISVAIILYFLLRKIENHVQTLDEMAKYDDLTDLPNRKMLRNYLAESIEQTSDDSQELAVIFLDLDRFKFVNDTQGHKTGDLLLHQIAERLAEHIDGKGLVAHQSGDEFVIVLPATNKDDVRAMLEKILKAFNQPFRLKGGNHFISSSIGISMYPDDGTDVEALLMKADRAMYRAKNSGKNQYQFYTVEPHDNLYRKVKLERDLRRALEAHELELYYQPQVRLDNNDLQGVEALIRWNHPELGLILPSEFIPIAEEVGLIIQIGNWVIETACKQNQVWKNLSFGPIRISVNVSAIQLQSNDFVEVLKRTLAQHQLPPETLVLEITESVMQNVQESINLLHEVRKLGVKVAIDDFGTGYSSLNIFGRLPIDALKIDKSFTHDMLTNTNTAFLVKTIISMGKHLNIDLIVEGIEDILQAQFLIENGCVCGQGFLYSPPLPVKELEKLLLQSADKRRMDVCPV